VEQILAWADAYYAEHGTWPVVGPLAPAEPVAGAQGESWKAINHALALGLRGLPGDSSLGELLAEHRGAPAPDMGAQALARKIWAWEQEQFPIKGTQRRRGKSPSPRYPALTNEMVLAWADAHRVATGRWPTQNSGPVRGAPFAMLWASVNVALMKGSRSLPEGSSLARLLSAHRGRRNKNDLPRLTHEQILAWAEAHRAATGRWPTADLTPVTAAPGETWLAIHLALRVGRRGLPGGSTLRRLLSTYRQAPRPPLTVETIRAWASVHHEATGRWPTSAAGPVAGVPGENWSTINQALNRGRRGLPGGSDLPTVLSAPEYHNPALLGSRPKLTLDQILAWAQAHHTATGQWPRANSGPVQGVPEERWHNINLALRSGHRGLPGDISLAALIREQLDPSSFALVKKLSVDQILAWADAHHAATGGWPSPRSGAVAGAPGERWSSIEGALRSGCRGLPRGLSLRRLLVLHRNVNPRGVARAGDRNW